jgi:hypothetical protein
VVNWRRRSGVLERRASDGLLLLPVDGHDVTLLAGTGLQLWEVLREARSTDELTRALQGRYAGDSNTIRADLEAALAELEHAGLVCREL